MTTDTTTLILAVHGHQPVGNFDWVLGEAYAKAYRPFLEVIERHPTLKWTMHLSGPLVEWLQRERPEYLRRMAALVRRGQVEVMGGGYAEPILCWLPARDAVGQLTRFSRQLTALKMGPIRGAWLAERVWEPSVPRLFHAAGLEYTVVDDHHLTLAGVAGPPQFGYWITEDAGDTVAVFPSSKSLRYLVPFKPVEQVLDHLRALRSGEPRAVVLADDLEKFGLWPGTFSWVYEEGWLERFCRGLEQAQAWVKTYTVSQYLGAYPPLGRVAIPCASYEEMQQWSGGHFRNFLTKYPEANTMYQKMVWMSRRLDEARSRMRGGRSSKPLREAETHLYRGQGNDAYWHGIFGGIYLHHLRAATYRELLTAERLLDRAHAGARAWGAAEALDLDGDRQPELLLRSGLMDVTVDPDQGGAIVEWDDKVRALNLVNTMTRRREPYHERIAAPGPAPGAESSAGTALGPEGASGAASAGGGPETIHAGVRVKESHLEEHVVYDPYRRVAAIDHLWAAPSGDARAFARGEVPEGGALVERPYRWRLERQVGTARAVLWRDVEVASTGRPLMLRVTKAITVSRRLPQLGVEYTVLNTGAAPATVRFGSEWNVALKDAHFNRVGEIRELQRLVVTDPHADVRLELLASVPGGCWYFPVETVSDSEAGLERTYQHVCLMLFWDVTCEPRRPWRVRLTHTVGSGGVHAAV